MEIRPKSPAHIMAQVAAFAASEIAIRGDREEISNSIGELATHELHDVQRTPESNEIAFMPDGSDSVIPRGEVRTAATAKDYVAYLRQVHGSKAEQIASRLDLQEAYKPFTEAIDELKSELSVLDQPDEHPSFLGKGEESHVFTVTVEDKDYVVRIPKSIKDRVRKTDAYVEGLALGKGLPRMEQVVAISYEDGVTISELMPGKDLTKLTAIEIENISENQLRQLIDLVDIAHQRGIYIDPHSANIMYDAVEGFGIIDYGSASSYRLKAFAPRNLGAAVAAVAHAFARVNRPQMEASQPVTKEYFADTVRLYQADQSVLSKFRRVALNKLGEEDFNTIRRSIDADLSVTASFANLYSNNDRVEELIAEDKERIRHRSRDEHTSPTLPDENWM